MNRAVVNVATDSWARGQKRLLDHLGGSETARIWSNALPAGCPPHRQHGVVGGAPEACRPYAFKAYALREAALEGYTTLLWCDASIVPIRPLGPLWERIEREGYWIGRNGWNNSDWTADSAYADLFAGMELEEARALNRTIPHVVGTAFGIDLLSTVGKLFLHEYFRLATTRAFCGPWQNSAAPRVAHRNEDRPAGPCGPVTTLGHRHDQTAMAVIAWRLKMKLTDGQEVFSYAKVDERGKAILDPAQYGENTLLLAAGI